MNQQFKNEVVLYMVSPSEFIITHTTGKFHTCIENKGSLPCSQKSVIWDYQNLVKSNPYSIPYSFKTYLILSSNKNLTAPSRSYIKNVFVNCSILLCWLKQWQTSRLNSKPTNLYIFQYTGYTFRHYRPLFLRQPQAICLFSSIDQICY